MAVSQNAMNQARKQAGTHGIKQVSKEGMKQASKTDTQHANDQVETGKHAGTQRSKEASNEVTLQSPISKQQQAISSKQASTCKQASIISKQESISKQPNTSEARMVRLICLLDLHTSAQL